MNSTILRGGTIIDGTGGKPFRGDVWIEGDLIRAVGEVEKGIVGKELDVTGLSVVPGFIDLHTHTDRKIFDNPMGDSKIMQGVTTDVTSNCGVGPFPANPCRIAELESYLNTLSGSLPKGGVSWTDFHGFAAAVEKVGPGMNLVMLAAQGAVRIAGVGWDDRPPTETELTQMQAMLDESLQQGAWGMSSGLIYPPGSFAQADELTALAKVLAKRQALYASHIRGESATLMDSIEEAIALGQKSGARVQISHLKAIGKPFWGQGLAALRRIEQARSDGVDIWADQYPYEATATSLAALVPGWAQDGGIGALLGRLENPDLNAKILTAILKEMTIRGGPDRVKISVVRTNKNQIWVGKTILDVATARNIAPEEAVRQLLLEESAKINAVYFSLGEIDLEGIMQSPHVAVGSDGQVMNPERDSAENVHPRSYGTFPRVLGRFVREKKLLPLELAVYKMSGLPAKILRLTDRGQLRPGLKADLTVFDADKVIDRADFTNPHQYPIGIPYVFVNGTQAVRDSKLTGEGRGEVLKKRGGNANG
jgi:N-acyl-D-amino-acid deacylase